MPQVDPIRAARSLYRTMMYREGHSVTLAQRNYLWPRLHAGTLFGKYEFASGEIPSRLRQQDSYLYWEDMFTVEVLVQTVVITFAILQKQWRGSELSCIMASLEEFVVLVGIAYIDAHSDIPAVGDRSETRIERRPKLLNHLGQRIAEVFVLTAPKSMSPHDNAAAKEVILWIHAGKCLAFLAR